MAREIEVWKIPDLTTDSDTSPVLLMMTLLMAVV
jgi:hypothetical protein